MRLWPGLCPDPTGGAYSASPDPIVTGGEGARLPPTLCPAGLEFLALGLKEVVHPWFIVLVVLIECSASSCGISQC